MYRCVSTESKVMADYRKLPPTGPRQLTSEMQTTLDVVDKPAKRGKKPDSKKHEKVGRSSQDATPKKRKTEQATPFETKKQKVKKMANKPKAASPSDSDYVPSYHDQEKSDEVEDAHLEGSPRGNTPPRSPPNEVPLNDSVPNPPPSPSHTTVSVSIAPLPPPVSSQYTTTALSLHQSSLKYLQQQPYPTLRFVSTYLIRGHLP
ncbi:uncharacterized protein LOC111906873 [Lactuca sativa]|uniref:uncharacterized protein LOC111906873 n=1 Tax=Lactuca sativa TaxID=4236 RepID=UPI000CD957AA|nr:uncharacterized protein LOC111906873 [Lactuca sativa]